jgi:hypothetical protein
VRRPAPPHRRIRPDRGHAEQENRQSALGEVAPAAQVGFPTASLARAVLSRQWCPLNGRGEGSQNRNGAGSSLMRLALLLLEPVALSWSVGGRSCNVSNGRVCCCSNWRRRVVSCRRA